MHARAQASNRLARANRASHGPSTGENPKESPKEPKVRSKVPKAHTRAKHRKLVYQVLKTRNQRQARKLRKWDTSVPLTILGLMMDGILTNGTMAGVLMNGMMNGVLLEGTKVVNNSASSFSLGSLDFGAMSSPKRFEWVKMNLDTGAAVNTLPLNLGPGGAGDGRFYRTASGEWILMVEHGSFKDTMQTVRSDL